MARTDYGAILSTKIADTSQAIRDVNKTVGTIAPADWGTLIRGMKSGADYQNALDQMVEETATGSIASFTDGANNIPCKEIICHINPTETGTGEKSPQNPYVIGGHSEINVSRLGANQWNEEWERGGYNNTTGEKRNISGRIRSKTATKVFPSTSYYVTFNSSALVVLEYDTNGVFLGIKSFSSSGAITTTANTAWVNFYLVANTYNNDISINYPSTDTTYHAYNGQTHTVPFDQTVYGGTLNVTTGVLTIDRILQIYDGSEIWRDNSQYGYYTGLNNRYMTDQTPVANYMEGLPAGSGSGLNNWQLRLNSSFQNLLVKPDLTQITTREEWKTFLAQNNLVVVLKLIESQYITIQLTPQEIKTLLGANNFYHDCNGDIDVTYRANGALYVEQHS